MSKAFYGTHRLRIGLRCKKEFSDDPLDVINSMEMLPKISAGIGYENCKIFLLTIIIINIEKNSCKFVKI